MKLLMTFLLIITSATVYMTDLPSPHRPEKCWPSENKRICKVCDVHGNCEIFLPGCPEGEDYFFTAYSRDNVRNTFTLCGPVCERRRCTTIGETAVILYIETMLCRCKTYFKDEGRGLLICSEIYRLDDLTDPCFYTAYAKLPSAQGESCPTPVGKNICKRCYQTKHKCVGMAPNCPRKHLTGDDAQENRIKVKGQGDLKIILRTCREICPWMTYLHLCTEEDQIAINTSDWTVICRCAKYTLAPDNTIRCQSVYTEEQDPCRL